MSEIKEFSIAVKAAEDWIDDLQRRLDWHDRERVYHALLATLHPLRDSLTGDEVSTSEHNCHRYCAASIMRAGILARAEPHPAAPQFLERIRDGVHREPGIHSEAVARAVFAMLAARLPSAEVEDAKAATPKSLHNLWPN